MLTEEELKSLIKLPESTILDFKAKMYELEDKNDKKALSKFVKDAICFSNSIRNESAFIVVGISELEDGSKGLCGIDKSFDDAFF